MCCEAFTYARTKERNGEPGHQFQIVVVLLMTFLLGSKVEFGEQYWEKENAPCSMEISDMVWQYNSRVHMHVHHTCTYAQVVHMLSRLGGLHNSKVPYLLLA